MDKNKKKTHKNTKQNCVFHRETNSDLELPQAEHLQQWAVSLWPSAAITAVGHFILWSRDLPMLFTIQA